MADWVAIIALVLAIFAIITIIIVIFLVLRDNDLVRAVADQWTVVQGGATASESFNGGPDSIYIVNPGIVAPRNIAIIPYANIASGVTEGSSTTIFIIDNTQHANAVTLISGSGTPVVIQGSATIAANVSAEFMWFNQTTIRRLR